MYIKYMIMTISVWRRYKTEKTKISTLFLLFKNMIKSSQILSIENTICSK